MKPICTTRLERLAARNGRAADGRRDSGTPRVTAPSITAEEIRGRLAEWLERVEASGISITITRQGVPIARLGPTAERTRRSGKLLDASRAFGARPSDDALPRLARCADRCRIDETLRP